MIWTFIKIEKKITMLTKICLHFFIFDLRAKKVSEQNYFVFQPNTFVAKDQPIEWNDIVYQGPFGLDSSGVIEKFQQILQVWRKIRCEIFVEF